MVLSEVRSSTEIAPGVVLYSMKIGHPAPSDTFEVEVGFVRNPVHAAPLVDALRSAGYATKLVATADGAATGYTVRLEKKYSAASEADAAVTAVQALKTLPAATAQLFVDARRRYTAEDGMPTTGPFVMNLLAVKPGFRGTLLSALGTDVVPGRETTTSLAARKGALAAINGGFFSTAAANGSEGALAGLSVVDGRLVNEGVEGRPALFLENSNGINRARVERKLSTVISVSVEGRAARRIDGTNRRPGATFNCGRPFDKPVNVPLHDAVCTNDNALIVYTPDFGTTTSTNVTGMVTEAVLDSKGIVIAMNDTAGSKIPADGQVLQGNGSAANWLKANMAKGISVAVSRKLVGERGQEISLKPGMYAINGGPTLLVNSNMVEAEHAAEGWSNNDVPGYLFTMTNGNRANFYNGWYVRRNPHTAVGVTADGTILMLVVDGRAPRHSAGLSIKETAAVMKYLGAIDAIKLDGGGSSMMVVNNVALTLPADAGNVERPDGDALLIMK